MGGLDAAAATTLDALLVALLGGLVLAVLSVGWGVAGVHGVPVAVVPAGVPAHLAGMVTALGLMGACPLVSHAGGRC